MFLKVSNKLFCTILFTLNSNQLVKLPGALSYFSSRLFLLGLTSLGFRRRRLLFRGKTILKQLVWIISNINQHLINKETKVSWMGGNHSKEINRQVVFPGAIISWFNKI